MNLFFFLYVYLMSIISLILIRSHLFLCLVSLEFMVLFFLFLLIYYCLHFGNSNFYLFVYVMTFYVCEGVLGLSVMVCMIRFHGNDYINSMFLW
uniref:NADH dehydrogenase subunit 4L n=1 Tax=Bothrogonia tibetana TaxID=1902982 RepID=UPI0023F06C0E|nr:NADH dehydrogenase subunit 4L [Bothrogonia tibetana]WDZ68124.1 NADH dehydrogenase subunit 4L [Bothrogonia tibetana]